MNDHDPSKSAKADSPRVPGLLDQYRQQRQAWLAQADALVRMREEVRQAAEREAVEIVTAARRDVRRIIVEARRELLVLTAQLHAAVEATDAPTLEAPPFTALLADPEARMRVESATHDPDLTREVVHEARKGVRSVLDEARAEIEALASEAPAAFGLSDPNHSRANAPWLTGGPDQETGHDATPQGGHGDAAGAPSPEATDEFRADGPIHELHLDSALESLDFQARDLPIPTLERLLGADPASDTTPSERAGDRTAPESGSTDLLMAFDTPELRRLLEDHRDSDEPASAAPTVAAHPVLPEAEPFGTSPFAFDTAPRAEFFAEREADGARPTQPAVDDDSTAVGDAQQFTPSSPLFGDGDARSTRSARMWVGLFAATGAIAIIGTLWWAFGRDSAPLSAAAPPPVIADTPEADTPPAAPADVPATATPPADSSAPGTLALTIEARRPSWIRAQIDGKDEVGRIYQAGETRHIYGAHTVSIRAGDAGAVFVGLDGGTAHALGGDGMVVTKRFSAEAAPEATTASADGPSVTTASAPVPAAAPARAPVTEAVATAPRPQAPSPASQPPAGGPRTASPGGTDTAPGRDNVTGSRPDLVQAAQQWLDAYQRRDRETMNAMSTDSVSVSDERSVTERFPVWQGGVQRSLDEVALELTGDVAVFTARMTERVEAGEHVSRVSQFWQRRSGRWYVTNVRIIGEARLNQIIR